MPLSLKSPAGGNLSLEAPATASNYTLTTPDATAVAAYGDAPTGALILPSGTTAQRSGSPSAGNTRFNSTLGVIEIYNGIDWQDITKKLPSKYRLNRSLRFRASATAYLNRTNVASPTNDKIWTWSAWVKRGALSNGILFGFVDMSTLYQDVILFATDKIRYVQYVAGTLTAEINTVQLFRDISSWYHIVVAVDTTQATAANRFKLYVNGTRITAFSPETYAAQNQVGYINKASQPQGIGVWYPYQTNNWFDGYLTEVNFIDGQALDSSYFGENDVFSEVWIPKAYSGTYGTNGYYLKFEDNSAATAAAIGKDSSGNSNNWTPNNISLTAGVTYDSMTDVPTITSATVANFAVINPLAKVGSPPTNFGTLSNGNLTHTESGSETGNYLSTMSIAPNSGKFYFEVTVNVLMPTYAYYPVTGLFPVGSESAATIRFAGYNVQGFAYYSSGTTYANNNSTGGSGTAVSVGQTRCFAYDSATGKLWTRINNGAWENSGNPVAGTNPTATLSTAYSYFPYAANYQSTSTSCYGQQPFQYTPPTGFVALNAYNLPDNTNL